MNHEPPESGTSPIPMKPGTNVAASAAIRMSQARGERESGAGARAVDSRDHRLLEPPDQTDVRVVRLLEPLADRARDLLELLQVLPGAETAAGARDHDRPDLRVGRFFRARLVGGMESGVESVEDLGPIQGDRGTASSRDVSTSLMRRA